MTEFVRVDEWKEDEHPIYIYLNGKTLVMPFDKIFNNEDLNIGVFILKKISFINRMTRYYTSTQEEVKGVCHYINYFINEYDEDKETVHAYLRLKYHIDKKSNHYTPEEFNKLLHSTLLSDTMIEKIDKMVEDNYFIDLTPKGKDFEQLEFTNEHAKIMMKISMAMKLMIAPMMHYINMNNLLKKKETIYDFFLPLFDTFQDGTSDIYAKLWLTIQSRVNTSVKRHGTMWDQHEVYGTEPSAQAEKFLREDIITETMFRYTFDGNVINLNSVVIKGQLEFFIRTKHDHNLVEVNNVKDAEGLSGMDKLEMNSHKIDESLPIISRLNTEDLITQLERNIGMKIEKKEIKYYLKHHKISKIQSDFVFYYFAKYFGYNDLRLLNRTNYVKILIILKRTLQYEGFIYLPQIITGNIESISKRTIRNQKFAQRIESSDVYQNIMKNKFPALVEMGKSDYIIKQLSMFLNSTFTTVDYDNQDKLGQLCEIAIPDILSAEILEYLNMI